MPLDHLFTRDASGLRRCTTCGGQSPSADDFIEHALLCPRITAARVVGVMCYAGSHEACFLAECDCRNSDDHPRDVITTISPKAFTHP